MTTIDPVENNPKNLSGNNGDSAGKNKTPTGSSDGDNDDDADPFAMLSKEFDKSRSKGSTYGNGIYSLTLIVTLISWRKTIRDEKIGVYQQSDY